ncbi:MAG: hypothetical protein GY699_11415 [Desulfobacteraceae bacterium]|nr:hypothetical protein [Desulfobacteraceae bacterium]
MSNRLITIFAILSILMAMILTGCSTMGIYAANGQVTTPGLPPVFVSGTDWHLDHVKDSRAEGTTLHISADGEVIVKKDNTLVPSKIENGEIVLGGILKNFFIYSKTIETMGMVRIKVHEKNYYDRTVAKSLGLFVRDSKN